MKGKHEGAECYCGNCDDRTDNNGHLGLHVQIGHGVGMEVEMCTVELDGRAVGNCSGTATHTGTCC